MPLPECTCEIEVDTVQKMGRYYPCSLHKAAPDLYEALDALLSDGLDEDQLAYLIDQVHVSKARAALAKARGEQK